MVVSAYVLIQTEVGKAASVTEAVAGIEGVRTAETVVGPYDAIVRVEGASLDAMEEILRSLLDPNRNGS